MSVSGSQVQQLLSTLNKHADLVAEAFEGSVSTGDKQRNASLEELFGLGILKPYEEDVYRLNPLLRDFLADHFSTYQAFQALRRVSGTMRQAMLQWSEARRLKSVGAMADMSRMLAAFDESVVDIAYSIEHNLMLLHSLLSTQYGNVQNLQTKLRQNRYYGQQVVDFLADAQNIERMVEEISLEAIASGLPQVRQLVMRRLGAKRLQWTSQIKDAQNVISARLFEARLMEQKLKRLSRFSLWLSRNKTADGWDVAVDAKSPASLLRPDAVDVRPQPDVTDTYNAEQMLDAAAKLPAREVPPAVQDAPVVQLVIEEDEVLHDVQSPESLALDSLASLTKVPGEPVSLLDWKRQSTLGISLADDAWLAFAYQQLHGLGLNLEFVSAPVLDLFPVNDIFHDILLHREAPNAFRVASA